MTAEQLEELLRWYEQDNNVIKHKSALGSLQVLAPSLARRVICAEKLVEALDEYFSARTDFAVEVAENKLTSALTAYREASK